MAISVVLHRVADYPAWRQVYDSLADVQKAGGVTAESVHRTPGDPDNVLVIHEFETLGEAQAFFASEDLQNGMRQAGVVGQPRIEFYE
jgi:hypothetical protein